MYRRASAATRGLLGAAGAHAIGLRRLLLLAFPVGCALAALAIGQDANYDLLNYHYYIAYAFLHDRLPIDVYPAQLQSLLNPLLDVPIFLLMNHVPPRVETAILGAIEGLNPVVVYAIGRRVARSELVAVAAALAAALGGGFVSEIGASTGDTLVSIPILLGVLCAVRAMGLAPVGSGSTARTDVGTRHAAWWWAASGAAAGFGSGLKLSELPVGVGVVLAVLVVRGRHAQRLGRFAASAVGGVVGVAASSGYWSWYLWRHYKDPIAFTQASFGIFHSPNVPKPRLAGGGYGPKSVLQGLDFPLRWVVHPLAVGEIPFRELSLPLAYVLAAVLVLALAARALLRTVARHRPGRRALVAGGPAGDGTPSARGETSLRASGARDADADRFLVATFGVSLALWMRVFSIYRYLLPLEMLSPVVILAVVRRLIALVPADSRWASRAARSLVPAVLIACALCVATESPGNYWLRVPFGSTYFSLRTPPLLDNAKVDALVEVGGQPMGFLFPQLPSRVVAIGGIGNLLTPANRVLVHRALARVRRDGGSVDVVFVDVPARHGLATPKGTSRYLARLGAPGLVARACEVEAAHIGAGFEPVTFCRFAPR